MITDVRSLLNTEKLPSKLHHQLHKANPPCEARYPNRLLACEEQWRRANNSLSRDT